MGKKKRRDHREVITSKTRQTASKSIFGVIGNISLNDILERRKDSDRKTVETPKPSQLRKQWHPEEDNRSLNIELKPKDLDEKLTGDQVEFLLDRLPSSNRHHDFERFATCLCEYEICRNIRPSTGPVAGGDRGEDASNYPVAEENREPYFWNGTGSQEIGDNWLFAYSTKKDWSSKVREDMKKANIFKPKPTRLIFVTSQSVAISKRQNKEAKLNEEFGIELTILDRSWIINQVIHKGHIWPVFLYLGGDSLSISQSLNEYQHQTSHKNEAAKNRIEELHSRIPYRSYYNGFMQHRIEDLIELSELLKYDDSKKDDIIAYCKEAIIESEKIDSKYNVMRAIYSFFHISMWYWDDPGLSLEYLPKFFECIFQVDSIEAVEKGFNVFHALFGAILHNIITIEHVIDVDDISRKLRTKTEEFIRSNVKSSHGLLALELSVFLKILFLGPDNAGKLIEDIVSDLRYIVKQSESFTLFPLIRLKERILDLIEMGIPLSGSRQYYSLLDEISNSLQKRYGDGQRAEFANRLGWQYLDQNNYKKAIRYFSDSNIKWFSNETLNESVTSSLLCGLCYDYLGLRLAAKFEYLNVVNWGSFKDDSSNIRQVSHALYNLYHVEMRRGRALLALWWAHAYDRFSNLYRSKFDKIVSKEEPLHLLVSAEIALLVGYSHRYRPELLNSLKPAIRKLGLEFPGLMLSVMENGIEEATGKFHVSETDVVESVKSLYNGINDSASMPEDLSVFIDESSDTITEEFSIVGVKFRFISENNYICNQFHETLGAILQIFFNDVRMENLAIFEEEIEFFIKKSAEDLDEPKITENSDPQKISLTIYVSENSIKNFQDPDTFVAKAWFNYFIYQLLQAICLDKAKDLLLEIAWMYNDGAFHRAFSSGTLLHFMHKWQGEEAYNGSFWR